MLRFFTGLILVLMLLVGGYFFLFPTRSSESPVLDMETDAPVVEDPALKAYLTPELEALEQQWEEWEAQSLEAVVAENANFTITEREKKKWDFHVEKAIYLEDEKGARLKDISGTLYNEAGTIAAIFMAPYGSLTQEQQEIELMGGVLIKTKPSEGQRPVRVKAPEMSWNAEEDKLVASKGVILESVGFGRTTADSAIFELDFSSIELRGNASSAFQKP